MACRPAGLGLADPVGAELDEPKLNLLFNDVLKKCSAVTSPQVCDSKTLCGWALTSNATNAESGEPVDESKGTCVVDQGALLYLPDPRKDLAQFSDPQTSLRGQSKGEAEKICRQGSFLQRFLGPPHWAGGCSILSKYFFPWNTWKEVLDGQDGTWLSNISDSISGVSRTYLLRIFCHSVLCKLV